MLDSRLLRAAGKANRFVLGAVACQWAGLLVSVATVLLLAYVMSLLAAGDLTPATLALMLALMALGVVLRALLTLLATRLSGLAAEGVKHTMRRKIYCHLLVLGNSYSSHVSTAEATQLAGEGVEQLEPYFSGYLPQLLYGLLAPLTLFVVLLFFNPIIALVLLVCVPLIPLSIVMVRKIARRFMRSFWGEYAQLGTTFLENVQGLTTLKIYGADAYRHQQMDERAQRFRQVTMRVLGMQLNSIFFMDAIAFGGAALGIILAIQSCMSGSIGLGACLAIVLLSADFFIPLRQLGSSFHVASTGLAAAERMFKLFVEQESPQITILRMRFTCWITKVTHTHARAQAHTHTHTVYLILTAFPRQQWFRERASFLRYTYIASLVLHVIST